MAFDMDAIWYRMNHPLLRWLIPFSWGYRFAVSLRKSLYRLDLLKSTRFAVRIIVVGNLSVGGTGKTPLVIWMAKWLTAKGYRVGLVSRGYGGKATHWPQTVLADSNPSLVGDEPVLIVNKTQCPMVVGPDRVAAVAKLLAEHECQVVLSDDGLQHYALARDLEIAVVDGQREFGNRYCLPAGPLREPLQRLDQVDMVIYNELRLSHPYHFNVIPEALRSLADPQQPFSPKDKQNTVHAVAAIGNPERFFNSLRKLGLTVIEHRYPDHFQLQASHIEYNDFPVVMTEKDAVKCSSFCDQRHWCLPIYVQPNTQFIQQFEYKISQLFDLTP